MTAETEKPAQDTPEGSADTSMDADLSAAEQEAAIAQAEAPIEGDSDVETAPAGADVAALQAEIAELKDKLLRAVADQENTRRIASREKADAGKYAITNFARDMLRVADYLSMATMAVTDEAREADPNLNNLCVGIDMTMKELLNVFEGQGIKPIKAEGQIFNHNLHEAISQEEKPDVPKGTILAVQRGGFTIQDRLLRPAQVTVSTGGPKSGDDEESATASDGRDDGTPGGAQQAYENVNTAPGQAFDQET